MKNKSIYIELFDKFSNGELNEIELTDFKRRLKEDKLFLDEYKIYQEMIASMHYGVEQEIASDLKQINAELHAEGFFEEFILEEERKKIVMVDKQAGAEVKKQEVTIAKEENSYKKIGEKSKRIPFYKNKKILSVAASVLLLCGLFGISNIWFSNNKLIEITNKKLEPITINLRGATNEDIFEQGIEAFERNNSIEAIQFFEKIASNDEKYIDARYILAFIQFKTKMFNESIENAKLVRTLVKSKRPELEQQAEWLQIQAMLAANQTDTTEFEELLRLILSNEKHLFADEAIRLNGRLKSIWRKLVI